MELVLKIVLIVLLLVASVVDFRIKEIHIAVIIGCGLLSLVYSIAAVYLGECTVFDTLLALIPGAIMLLVSRLSRQRLGYGDGLMALAVAPVFGLEGVMFALFIAFSASGMLSIILLILRKAGRNTRIPFLPFMTVGLGVMMLAKV